MLAEYSHMAGNFPLVTRALLAKIAIDKDTRMSYVYDSYMFHYVVESTIVFLVMCSNDDTTKKRVAFQFLEDIRKDWRLRYDEQVENKAIAFAMQGDFSPILQGQMNRYNNDKDFAAGTDNIEKIRNQIDSVKEIMCENIDNLLERGEKIELLVDKTDQLSHSAFKFERSSKSLKNTILWNQIKMYLMIFAIIGVFCLFISMLVCGFSLDQCGAKENEVETQTKDNGGNFSMT